MNSIKVRKISGVIFFLLVVTLKAATSSSYDWVKMESMPRSFFLHTSVAADGFLYVFGGGGGPFVYYTQINSDGSLGKWKQAPSIPDSVVYNYSKAIVHDNRIYLLGGHDRGDRQKRGCYTTMNPDGSLGQWEIATFGTDLPMQGGAAVVHKNDIYYLGSWFSRQNHRAVIEKSGDIKEWSETTKFLSPRGSFDAFEFNGRIYAIGGNTGIQPHTAQDTVFVSSINADGDLSSWSRTTQLPSPRYGYAGVLAGDTIFVIGGNSRKGTTAEVLFSKILDNGHLDEWNTFTPLPMARHDSAAAYYKGWIYVTGGFLEREGRRHTNEVYGIPVTKIVAAKENPVTVENRFYKIIIDPKKGGSCVELVDKETGDQLIAGAAPSLFRNFFTAQQLEQELPEVHYDYSLNEFDGRTEILLTGVLDQNFSDIGITGLHIERIITLHAEKRGIDIKSTFTNRTEKPMGLAQGVHNSFVINEQENDIYYLPTVNNINVIQRDRINMYYTKPGDWEFSPVDGWMGIKDSASDTGIIFLMDYNHLNGFYTSSRKNTLAWLMDERLLLPGRDLSYSYTVVPIKGLPGFVHGSQRIVADIQVRTLKDKIIITNYLAGVRHAGPVHLEINKYGIRSQKNIKLSDVSYERINHVPKLEIMEITGIQKEPFVIRVIARGEGWKESYETFFEGRFPSVAFPGYPIMSEYNRPKPRKEK